MDELCTYRIEVQGQVNESDLNAMSPLQMTVVHGQDPKGLHQVHACIDPCQDQNLDPSKLLTKPLGSSTLVTVRTDQSGLIGLMRHLHGRGLVFLSVYRER
jgi:hypothetical protein